VSSGILLFGHIPAHSAVYTTLNVVWNCLAYANSCVNPIIYNYTCRDFRAAFRSVVHGCCIHTDEVSEVGDGDEVDDDDNDDDDAEPAVELQLRTDVTVVSRLRSMASNRPKTVPVVGLEASCSV